MTPTRYLTLAVAAVALVLVLAGRGAEASTHDDCGVAQTAFSDCTAYINGVEKKVSPRCCEGLSDIKYLALTAAQRRAICTCILSEMLAAGKVNSARAAGLPAACDVHIGFIPTNPEFNYEGLLFLLPQSSLLFWSVDKRLVPTPNATMFLFTNSAAIIAATFAALTLFIAPSSLIPDAELSKTLSGVEYGLQYVEFHNFNMRLKQSVQQQEMLGI